MVLSFAFVLLSIPITTSMQVLKLERQPGSTVVLPPCLSNASLPEDNATIILFKSDSGELLSLNGMLISENPRLLMKNQNSTELVIRTIEFADQGMYECRTDQTVNYIVHLTVVKSFVIHLTVIEGSNVTLQCLNIGMWIIEESHRGGPVRTQYTSELVLTNIRRNDARFRTIICSTLDGHEKREYVIDVLYKPTVRLSILAEERLMCTVCARPMPHRIQWSRNGRKEPDENAHQTNINQSCIAQQFTFRSEKKDDRRQVIQCEAENKYGIDQDSLVFEGSMRRSSTKTRLTLMNTSSNALATGLNVTNRSSIIRGTLQSSFAARFLLIFSEYFITVIRDWKINDVS